MSLRRLARSLGGLAVALGVAFALPATADAASTVRQEPPLVIEKTVNTPTPFSQGQFVTYTPRGVELRVRDPVGTSDRR